MEVVGLIAQLKMLSLPCHFFQLGMCASSPTTCIRLPQLPLPSIQSQALFPQKPEILSTLSAPFEALRFMQSPVGPH